MSMHRIGKAVVGIGMAGMALVGVGACQGGTTHPPAHPATYTKADCKAAMTSAFKVEIAKVAIGEDIGNDPTIKPKECSGMDAATEKTIASEVLSENADAMLSASIAGALVTTP